jgi:DNA repair exonuclease SbcCD ATPase subunit
MTDDDLRLAKERLMKLWDAYESQELELQAAVKKVGSLETRNKDKERVLETLRELVESKDQELRKVEIERSSLDRESTDYRSRLEETSSSLNQEKARYKKLFIITQELEREVDRLTRELEERDRWFRDNMSFFEEFPTRVGKRLGMVSKPRKSLLEELGDKPALPKESGEGAKTTFQRVDPSEEALRSFMDIPGLDEEKAKILVDAGYDSTDKLKGASPFELVKLDGITPTLARKITDHLKA